jgi:nitrate reductase gamma subunit
MTTLQIISLIALAICIVIFLFYLIRIVRLGKPKEFSVKSGDVNKGVLYSNTVAMLPNNKESAYLHLPSYTLGMLFHIGTFSSFLLFFLSFFKFFNQWLLNDHSIHYLIPLFLLVTFISGTLLFLKRFFNKDLRALSNIDDYLSNAFTTLFHLLTLLFLTFPAINVLHLLYYLSATLLFLYMPVGKLRHLLYYFSARYHLGFFYGWRNVWPVKKN